MATYGSDPLLGKAQTLPYDITTQQAILKRKRAIAEALMAQSMKAQPQTLNEGGTLRPANIAGPIQQVLGAILGQQQMGQLETEEQRVGQEYNRRIAEAIQKYQQTRQGAPVEISGPPEEGYTSAGFIQGAGDPRKAFTEAMATGLGPVMSMAQEDYKEAQKGAITPKELLQYGQHYDPESMQRLAAASGFNIPTGTFLGRPKVQEAGGVLYKTQDEKILPGREAVEKFVEADRGGIPITKGEVTGQEKGITGGPTQPEVSLEKGLDAESVKLLGEGYKEAIKAREGVSSALRAKHLAAQIPAENFGTLADVKLNVNKFLQSIGGKPLPETAKVEELKSAMGY